MALTTIGLAGCGTTDRDALYADLGAGLVAKGHLRTDAAPQDAPFTAADLATNFERIAFSYEFHFRGGRLVNRPISKPLARWQGEIRYKLVGDGMTPQDVADVLALTGRVEALTGLRFRRVNGAHDMLISVATADGRREVSRMLSAAGVEAFRMRYDRWRRTPGWICGATMMGAPGRPNDLTYAHIFMGAELDGVMRTSCLHEELVQALGLTNDHKDARPSIFNDDQEFALLTRHDEILLQALYDPRLRPGMSAVEAMPIARAIFAETMGPGPSVPRAVMASAPKGPAPATGASAQNRPAE